MPLLIVTILPPLSLIDHNTNTFWYVSPFFIEFVIIFKLAYLYQGQRLTLLFVSSSFVFISHLTNFLSYSVFMFVACLFLCHFAFEKEPARFET